MKIRYMCLFLSALFLFALALSGCAPAVQNQAETYEEEIRADPQEPEAEQEPEEEQEPVEELEPEAEQDPEEEQGEGLNWYRDAFDPDIPVLKDLYAWQFFVGAALNTDLLRENSIYRETAAKHYNVFVAENAMKPESIYPEDNGEYNFGDADMLMDFCEENDALLRGHTLCWHNQTPDFWFHDSETGELVSREALLARMEEYITTVVGHCKGRVHAWDVVNEAISDNGGLRREDESSLYPAIIGDLDGDGNDWDYIEKAFEFANAADPDAWLILNEYGIEYNDRKLDDLCALLTDLMEKGIPVHGVGIQLHGSIYNTSAENVRNCIERLAEFKKYDPDFTIHITELDLSVFEYDDRSMQKEIDLATQAMLAQLYRELFDVFVEAGSKGYLNMVLTWGIYDGATWLDYYPIEGRRDAPLLFDENFKTKPAYWAVADPGHLTDALAEYMQRKEG